MGKIHPVVVAKFAGIQRADGVTSWYVAKSWILWADGAVSRRTRAGKELGGNLSGMMATALGSLHRREWAEYGGGVASVRQTGWAENKYGDYCTSRSEDWIVRWADGGESELHLSSSQRGFDMRLICRVETINLE